jgi:hypothetical protein
MSQKNEGESLERQAEEARKKLAAAEERADETVKRAAEELRELTEEQEATAERLRREVQEPTGPRQPPTPEDEAESGS